MATANIADFHDRLIANILDAEGLHHELAYGMHGRKLDFDLIPDDSDLYNEWVACNVAHLLHSQAEAPLAVIGVANGANRLARAAAASLKALGHATFVLYTEKINEREVALTAASRAGLVAALRFHPGNGNICVLEAVGTSGGTALTAVQSIMEAGGESQKITTQFTWQRRPTLEAFDAAGVELRHEALIRETLPTYTPEECDAVGYCALGWELVERRPIQTPDS